MTRGFSFLVALLAIAVNLRPSLTGVGPLLDTIREHLGLSATQAGILTSLPLLMFGAFAPVARLARSHGTERMALAGLLALIAGMLLRSEGSVLALFTGTVILSSGIAVLNVLIPTIVKQHYPDRVAGVTTAYATVMGGMAAIGSGVSVPLALALPGGWQTSLASWVIPAVVATLLWLPFIRGAHTTAAAPPPARIPWSSALAWQVTGYMATQSTVFYITISWYPALLGDAGYSAVNAGWLLTFYQVIAILVGLVVPSLARRVDQRTLAFGAGFLSACGSLGVLLAPQLAPVWMVVLGLGAGPGLILALSFMGLRAHDAQIAAALSLMAQSIGYLVAACGPMLFGVAHEHSGSWHVPMLAVVATALLQACFGLGAGRPARVGA